MLSFIFKVLLFAISVTFLLSWGYIKQQRKTQELLDLLHKKGEEKIMREFKKTEVLTIKEIEEFIRGTKASLFWSKNKLQVTDPRIVTRRVLSDMENKGLIVEIINKGPKKYKIK